jgi:hypothetical protein
MVKTNIQTFSGEVEILSNLHVGSYLTANGAASNVLDITGNVGATFFVGDGGFLSNIATTLSDIVNQGNVVSNVVTFEGNTNYAGVGLVTSSNVGIQNTNPLHTLSIGDKIRVNNNTDESLGESVIEVDGRILATRFEGDGGLLSNIATTLESIVNQGNVSANVVKFSSNASVSEFAGAGLVTDSNVGIQNTAPTYNLSVGSNLHVNDTGSNVLTVHGNVVASNLNLGVFSVTPAYGLNDVCNTSNGTSNVVQFQNATTSLVATSNITVGGNVTAQQLISTSNTEVGDRLKFSGSNVFVDTLRVADVAANIVTYDRTTGELLDSSGTFMNKFAVVSEQPPSDLFANATTVANHGGYTLTTSNLATNSNTYNAFDGTANAWVSGDLAGGYIGGANVFHENNLTQLSNLHPTQFGDWLAIEFPYKTTLRHMKLTPLTAAQFPASANIYATNNDLTWTEVNYWKDVNPVTASNVQTITVNATEQFKKYALVATKAAGNSSNVALQDWQLFTESFSIDGGKVAMAQQAATGGETVMDQHGPHGRGVAKLKKYPEIAFDASKVDGNDSTNTYVQAGYTVTASSQDYRSSRSPWCAFDDNDSTHQEFNAAVHLYDGGNGTNPGFATTNAVETTNVDGSGTYRGEWLQIELPNKIKLNKYVLGKRASGITGIMPKEAKILGSNDGTNWTTVYDHNDTRGPYSTSATIVEKRIFQVNSSSYYKYFRLATNKLFPTGLLNDNTMTPNIAEWSLYGYEEDPPLGDTSVDTTFTSIMNTPQTTGAQVYVDGNLGETFTNRVVGPTVSNTHTTYVSTEKYWELSGNVESNVTLEANTFLSGDAPHSISMWFNSSNLVSNASNSCIFSLATEEKLDSVNLDLQSNTWHNLTYAYQGEGGSRVTYLDGRKVAEDQAEDTFGDYPPFAMTGYSQGGYVASASGVGIAGYAPYAAFRPDTGGYAEHWVSGKTYATSDPRESTNSTLSTWIGGGGGHNGEWVKIQMPHKIVLEYVDIVPRVSSSGREPRLFSIVGSNDDINWYLVHEETTRTFTSSTGAPSPDIHVMTGPYATTYWKYFAVVIRTGATDNTYDYVAIGELKLYGHRENDLVRLPDPTNVLKYPHIAMTTETTLVQGPKINPGMPGDRGYEIIYSTHGGTPQLPSRAFDGNTNSTTNPNDAWLTSGGTYNTGDGALASGQTHALTIDGTSRGGSWLGMKMPRKLKLSSVVYYPRHGNGWEIYNGYVVGSNNGTSWDSLLTISAQTGWVANTPKTFTMTNNLNTYYQYFAILATHVQANNTVGRFAIQELEFYGTEEASQVPIQIGGGNIDKVANFRVYDKFIDQNQALEIWDAQKDEFGRAKSSMTLHKGRLGIGTTEPEGRLAVLDEPHNLEEFPPRAMTGYKTYMEGHGEFCASVSEEYGSADKAWNNFDKGSTNWTGGTSYTGTNNTYEGTHTTGGYGGDYIELKLPYKIKLQEFIIQPSPTFLDRWSKSGVIMAKNTNNDTWTNIFSWSGSSVASVDAYNPVYFKGVDTSNAFDTFRLVITSVYSQPYVTLFQWKLFGTREQGQSVLHDGQLTLTKNLTVPRIGPALDADDTPRRDRLVVEYNTSTNPTFEGAVRDTSGRGLDGVFVGGASYDATGKAFEFDGSNYHIITGNIGNPAGAYVNSASFWVNPDVLGGVFMQLGEGPEAAAKRLQVAIAASNQVTFGLNGSNTLFASTGISIGSWFHVAYSYDGGLSGSSSTAYKLYVNGVSIAGPTGGTSAATLNLNANAILAIGADHFGAGALFNGKISNFKLYDCALTAEEVKTLYDMGRCDEGHHVVNFSKTRVGIGLGDGEAPMGDMHVRGPVVLGPGTLPEDYWFQPALTIFETFRASTSARPGGGIQFCQYDSPGQGWMMGVDTDVVSSTNGCELVWEFHNNGSRTGRGAQLSAAPAITSINFTGQHRTFIKDVPFSQVGDLEGLIVSSDQNKYIKMSGGIEAGSNAITTNESLPIVSLSNVVTDKKCFGVISASEDPKQRSDAYGNFKSFYPKEKGDTRVYINSVGEGAIWVSNIGGSLEAGDYITTSNVAGYGQKQESDSLKNYTVAKITMDCDFNPATQPIQQILRSNVIQTYYLGNVHKVKNVPHEFVTTTVTADDAWSNVSVSPSDVTYAEWSNLEANTQNTYTLTYTQTSNVVYDTKYTLTTTANVTESDAWDRVSIDPPGVTYAEYSNLEANTQSSYSLTFTKTTTDEKTPEEWSSLESNTQSLYNMVYYQSVEEEVASDYPGATTHTRVTDVIENELDAHGQIQWEDHATETEKAYKIRYLDASGAQTDEANAVHIAAFVGCTYHCG